MSCLNLEILPTKPIASTEVASKENCILLVCLAKTLIFFKIRMAFWRVVLR